MSLIDKLKKDLNSFNTKLKREEKKKVKNEGKIYHLKKAIELTQTEIKNLNQE